MPAFESSRLFHTLLFLQTKDIVGYHLLKNWASDNKSSYMGRENRREVWELSLSPSILSLSYTFACTEKSSYGLHSGGLFSWTTVLVSIYIHGSEVDLLTEICGLRYDGWSYAVFQLISIGPWAVGLLRHMPFHAYLLSIYFKTINSVGWVNINSVSLLS